MVNSFLFLHSITGVLYFQKAVYTKKSSTQSVRPASKVSSPAAIQPARAPASSATAADADDDAAAGSDGEQSVASSQQSFTDHDLYCDICMGGESEYPNEIVICDHCAKGAVWLVGTAL